MNDMIQILLSVAGAEAVTGSMQTIVDKSGELGGAFLRLAGTAATIDSALDGMRSALDLGTAMSVLSARTGESIQSLVIMQRAFETAGIGADMMGVMINRLQKAMSGVNEMGKSTKGALAALGLSSEALQGLNFDEQLAKLAEGFQKIQDPAQRAAIAMDLFGREGGQMLMLLTSKGLLSAAAEDAGRLAQRTQEDAAAFKEVTDKLSLMKTRLTEMWMVAVEKVLPALSAIGDIVKGLNLAPLGAALAVGGSLALAGGLAAGLATKLNSMLWTWAAGPGVSAAGQDFALKFILPLSEGLSTLFATALPLVIVGAIAGAILMAIAEGMQQAQDAAQTAYVAGRKPGDEAIHAKLGVTNRDDEAKVRLDNQEKLKKATADLAIAQEELDHAYDGFQFPWDFADAGATAKAKIKGLTESIEILQTAIATPIKGTVLEQTAEQADNAKFKLLDLETLQKEYDKTVLKGKDDQAKLDILSAQRNKILSEQGTGAFGAGPKNAGLDPAQAKAKALELAIELEAVETEIANVNKSVTAENKKQADHAAKIAELTLQTQILGAHTAGHTAEEEALKETLTRLQVTKQLRDEGVTDEAVITAAVNARIADDKQAFQLAQDNIALSREKQAMLDAMTAKQEELNGIESDYTKTDAEKWALKLANLRQQNALMDAYLAKLKSERDAAVAAGNQPHADVLTKEIGSGEKEQKGITKQEGALGPDPNDFSANWTSVLTNLRTQWTITGASIAQSLGSVLSSMQGGISSAIDGLIMRTKTWSQAFWTVAGAIRDSVVKAASDMAAKWIMEYVVMDNARRLFHALGIGEQAAATTTEVAVHGAGETAKTGHTLMASIARRLIHLGETIFHGLQVALRTAVHIAGEVAKTASTLAGAAIRIPTVIMESIANVIQAAAGAMSAMASIPYVGPILAVAAMAAMIGVGMGLVKGIGKGFSAGGYTGEDGGIVHPREFVFSAPAVESIGLGTLQGLHDAALNPGPTSTRQKSAGAKGESPTVHFGIYDRRTSVEDFFASGRGKKMLYDAVSRRTSEVA